MCAPKTTALGYRAIYGAPRNAAPKIQQTVDETPSAPQAASLAVAALWRRLPRELAAQVVGFLAGSNGWHMDDACELGLGGLAMSIHAAQVYTPAGVCTSLAMDRAASVGNLPLVRWLHENRTEGCSQMAFYNAAKDNRLQVLQWLFAHKTADTQAAGIENGVLFHAVQAGHVSVVEWLCTSRSTITPLYSVFDHACRCGHLPMVRLLHRLGQLNSALAKATKNAMDAAADQGHLGVVQWLHENRDDGCTTNAMDYAASRGHLRVLQYLHHHRTEGCTRKALLNAVSGGHVKIVQWLIDESVVPVDATMLKEAMEFAAFRDNKELWSLLSQAQRLDTAVTPQNDLYVMTQMRMAT